MRYFKNKRVVILGFCIVLVLAAVAGYFFLLSKTKKPSDTIKKEYALEFLDYSGKTVHFSDYKKKPLVVFMWASWCPYCNAEIENLGKLKGIFGDEVNTVAVNRGEAVAVAKEFSDKIIDTSGVVFLLDTQDALYKSIKGYAMPETIFIDAAGNIVFHQRGPMPLKDASQKLNELLGR